jgi:leucyl/phenylalanyl-tRNA--protein transferase
VGNWDHNPTPVGDCRWAFPDSFPDDDLIAVGADLEPETIIAGYRRGLFPMPVGRDNAIGWWSPSPRAIIELDSLIVSRSLRRSAIRMRCSINEQFDDVIEHCARLPRKGSWISRDVVDAYRELHRLGWAHSIETWNDSGELIGGLYGVRIGGFFAGESMFHFATDASKVALVKLVEVMNQSRMALLDVQWLTPHLASLGAIEIERGHYLSRLASALVA